MQSMAAYLCHSKLHHISINLHSKQTVELGSEVVWCLDNLLHATIGNHVETVMDNAEILWP